MNLFYDEIELSMDDKVKAILTPEVVAKAIDQVWHGTPYCCTFCGRKMYV